MKVEVAIIDTSERGVQVALGEGTPFWLPRTAPGLEWLSVPEIGAVVWARLPRWIVEKLSLAFRAAEEPKEPAKPAGGPTFREDEAIPF
jgi:hypothetical protein